MEGGRYRRGRIVSSTSSKRWIPIFFLSSFFFLRHRATHTDTNHWERVDILIETVKGEKRKFFRRITAFFRLIPYHDINKCRVWRARTATIFNRCESLTPSGRRKMNSFENVSWANEEEYVAGKNVNTDTGAHTETHNMHTHAKQEKNKFQRREYSFQLWIWKNEEKILNEAVTCSAGLEAISQRAGHADDIHETLGTKKMFCFWSRWWPYNCSRDDKHTHQKTTRKWRKILWVDDQLFLLHSCPVTPQTR